ncbi:hypothetical protein B9Z55_007726 [Caenorhabditis nigoni]|nr:hypothetical protein B9Z55_007726 [Caenorhabditis nigoni]
MLENVQALEKLKLEVAEEIKKDNQQKFDQLSDRLQLIEASISKLSKSNEESEKSKAGPKKDLIEQPTVSTNNTTNVAPDSDKRFKLKHMFKNVKKFEERMNNFSEWEDHFNVKWKLCVKRKNNHLGFYVHCGPIVPTDKWSIQTKIELKIVRKNQNDDIKTFDYCYKKAIGYGFNNILEWKKMRKEYLVKGNLTVEAEVSIIKTTGLEKPKIRKFDESQRDISDVTLYLAVQSSVFKALLLGGFSESKQSEVTLNGIDPDDFHYFLEVLYGESGIDETTVEGVALLADMYDAPTAMRRCEEFLMEKSKQSLKKKLKIANRYGLEKLEEKCMSEIAALEGKLYVAPKDTKVAKKQPKKKWFTFR